jgi:hypothetical protein
MKAHTLLYIIAIWFILLSFSAFPVGIWFTATFNNPGIIVGFFATVPLAFLGFGLLHLASWVEFRD